MMSLPAMSLGLRFCVSRNFERAGQGEVGANSMAASGLVFRSDLVGTGRAISILFGINGVRNLRSHLVGPPFPEFKARFSATAGWLCMAEITSGSSFEPNKPREHGYRIMCPSYISLVPRPSVNVERGSGDETTPR